MPYLGKDHTAVALLCSELGTTEVTVLEAHSLLFGILRSVHSVGKAVSVKADRYWHS